MFRLLVKILAGILLLIVVAALLGGSYRAWRQHESERALAIATPNGIDEGLFVGTAGGEQWVTIRGKDRRSPILFIVHGGPGAALSPLATAFLPYETDWTVVQWDQPGAGKTFKRAGDTLPPTTTIEGIAADGVAVVERVVERLGQERVVLLGFSWGSVVGLEMVRARPGLFSAYAGTGLFVHRDDGRAIAYDRVLRRARERGNAEAADALAASGPPPYETAEAARALSRWTTALSDESPVAANRLAQMLLVPRQSLGDVASYVLGYVASDELFDLGAMDLRKSPAAFDVPIVLIQGGEDYDTPVELAREYYETITAPSKTFVTLERAGHNALVNDPGRFAQALNEHVLPLAR